MKYKFNGEGGEFTIGILTNKERDFIFDNVKKLIVIILNIKFTEEFYVPSVDTIIYDGKIVEKDFLGETQIKERVHNIIEIDYAKDTNQFHNESILEFYTE